MGGGEGGAGRTPGGVGTGLGMQVRVSHKAVGAKMRRQRRNSKEPSASGKHEARADACRLALSVRHQAGWADGWPRGRAAGSLFSVHCAARASTPHCKGECAA